MFLKQPPFQYERDGQYIINDEAVILLARDNFSGSYLPSDFQSRAIVRTVLQEPFGNFAASRAMVAARRITTVNRYWQVADDVFQVGIPVARHITDRLEAGDESWLRNWAMANYRLLKQPVRIGRERDYNLYHIEEDSQFVRQYSEPWQRYCDNCASSELISTFTHEGVVWPSTYCRMCGARSNAQGKVVERFDPALIFRRYDASEEVCDQHAFEFGYPIGNVEPHSASRCFFCEQIASGKLQRSPQFA